MFTIVSSMAIGLIKLVLVKGLKVMARGMIVFANGMTTFANRIENNSALLNQDMKTDDLQSAPDQQVGRTTEANTGDDPQPAPDQQVGRTTQANTGDDPQPAPDQQVGRTTEANTGDDPQPAPKQQDGRTTEAVGCVYVFYFLEFPSRDYRNLDEDGHDRKSISQIVNSINNTGGHFTARENLKKEEFLSSLEEISHSSEDSADYLFFYLLSHGGNTDKEGNKDKANILTHDAELVPIMDIISYFREDVCQRFRGKPKIFVFQCCRGPMGMQKTPKSANKFDSGTQSNTFECNRTRLNSEILRIRRSLGNNMFVAYAATPDYMAYDTDIDNRGSYFTSYLREVMLHYGKEENINMLMTRVNRRMSRDIDRGQTWCQMSFLVSRLTKPFNFYDNLSQDSERAEENLGVGSGEETDSSLTPNLLANPDHPVTLNFEEEPMQSGI